MKISKNLNPIIISLVLCGVISLPLNAMAADAVQQSYIDQSENRDRQVEFAARKIESIRSAIMSYYTANLAWPTSLSQITSGASPYYSGDFKTPLGTITGVAGANNYTLQITDTVTQDTLRSAQHKYLAGKLDGVYSQGAKRTAVAFSVPQSATIIRNMLSRMPDTTGSGLNTMQANIDMGNNDIVNAKDITATGTLKAQEVVTNAGVSLNTVGANVTSLTNDVNALQSDLLIVENDVTALTNDVTENRTDIDLVTAQSTTNKEDIVNLKDTDQLLRADIDSVTDLATTNQQDIASTNIDVLANKAQITGLRNDVNTLDYKVTELDGKSIVHGNNISANKAEIEALKSADLAINNFINEMNNDLTDRLNKANSDITNNGNNIASNSAKISANWNLANQNKQAIKQNADDIEANTSEINKLKTDVSGINSTLTSHESTLNLFAGQIQSNKNGINGNTARSKNNETAITSVGSVANSAKDQSTENKVQVKLLWAAVEDIDPTPPPTPTPTPTETTVLIPSSGIVNVPSGSWSTFELLTKKEYIYWEYGTNTCINPAAVKAGSYTLQVESCENFCNKYGSFGGCTEYALALKATIAKGQRFSTKGQSTVFAKKAGGIYMLFRK